MIVWGGKSCSIDRAAVSVAQRDFMFVRTSFRAHETKRAGSFVLVISTLEVFHSLFPPSPDLDSKNPVAFCCSQAPNGGGLVKSHFSIV